MLRRHREISCVLAFAGDYAQNYAQNAKNGVLASISWLAKTR
jgi:hypothetical protein